MKKCKYCRYSYCGDECDVSGMNCRKNKVIKITELDKVHKFCPGYRFSLLKFLYWL